jgi:hypothetical protein
MTPRTICGKSSLNVKPLRSVSRHDRDHGNGMAATDLFQSSPMERPKTGERVQACRRPTMATHRSSSMLGCSPQSCSDLFWGFIQCRKNGLELLIFGLAMVAPQILSANKQQRCTIAIYYPGQGGCGFCRSASTPTWLPFHSH